MRQAAADVAHQRDADLDELGGDRTVVHQVGGQNEQRHRQQREAVQAVEHLLEDDDVGNGRQGRDAHEGHKAQGKRNRHAQEDEADEQNHQKRSKHYALPPFTRPQTCLMMLSAEKTIMLTALMGMHSQV